MYKILNYIVLLTVAFLGSPTPARDKARGLEDRPPGWDRGEKKGWQKDMPLSLTIPPGWVQGKKGFSLVMKSPRDCKKSSNVQGGSRSGKAKGR
jgi:hypothetical protein